MTDQEEAAREGEHSREATRTKEMNFILGEMDEKCS
jgi:hypothetical protein